MKLQELCELIVDCEHKTAPTQDTGYPSIRTPNIGRGYLILDSVNRVSEETYRLWTRRAVPQPGDLIMAREAPVGNVAIIPPRLQPCLGQRTLLIRPDHSKVDPSFLNYFLNGPYVQGLIHAKTNGVTVAHLNMGDVRSMELPELPPLPTQRRTADILSAYDDLIENNTRRIKILEQMAQMLFREWFVNFRFPGHEKVKMVGSELGPIPAEWKVGTVQDALVLQRGFDLPSSQRQRGNVPIYAATGINGYHNVAKVRGPGVITGRSGSLGKVILILEDFWPLNTTLWVKEFRQSNAAHAFFLLSNLRLSGFNSGAAVPTLNRNDIHGLPCLLPDSGTLDAFSECALPVFKLGRILEQKTRVLQKTRDLLLPRLVSGEISVEHIRTEVAVQTV